MRLKSLREKSRLTQDELATELGNGFSQGLISHYEQGFREPSMENLIKMCDFFHVSTDFLLGRTEEVNAAGEAGT